MNVKRVSKTLTVSICLLILAGCTVAGKKLQYYSENTCAKNNYSSEDQLQITYLGAGGYLMRRGKASILVSPFFSNSSFLTLGLFRIKSKKKHIEKYLPPVEDVDAILVGHSHYDHLMDIPYIVKQHAKKAVIYGNRAMKHLLAPAFKDNPGKLVALNDIAAAGGKEQGKWTKVSNDRIRFMAIKSEHAPHVCGISFFNGKTPDKDRDTLPKRASHWVPGQTFTFIIDFLAADGETVDFRIHYQDAASSPLKGFPPEGICNIDLAILCAASYHEVTDYPGRFLEKVKLDHIIIGHWENFFRSYSKPPRSVPFTNVKKFIKIVNANKQAHTTCHLPKPGTCLTYRIED
jgi:ribonuclease BN (tRNA processing enzyme)